MREKRSLLGCSGSFFWAGAAGGELRALAGARERHDPFDDIGGEQRGAQLDELVAAHRPQARAKLGGNEGRRILIVAAHVENPAGKWQPMVVAPVKSAPA